MSSVQSRSTVPDEEGLLESAATIWRHRWLIVILVVGTMLLTFVVMLQMPRIYEARAALIAPKEGAGTGLLGSVAASGLLQQASGASFPSFSQNRDLMLSILKSRTVAEALVERFDLQERYRSRYRGDVLRALDGRTTIEVSKEGVISIVVEDTDPQIAAQMANFYVEELDRLIARYGTGEAGRQRAFLTEQLARAKAQLDLREEALRRFQERNRAIVLQEQTRGAIEAAARLKGEIMAAEVQLQVVRNFATEANPEVVALRRRIEEMKRQLVQMQYGEGVVRSPEVALERRDFTVPFSRVPEVGLELARLTRDVKVQETLVNLLAQQVEQARIGEARDMPIVQVLDRAIPAERPSKPRVRLSVAIAGVSSLFSGIFLALILDPARRLIAHIGVMRRGRPR